MIKSKHKIKRTVFEDVFKSGALFHSDHMLFRCKKDINIKDIGVSFVVPKKVQKSAVRRSMFKRKGYSVIEQVIEDVKTPFLGIFIIKKPFESNNVSYKELEEEIIFLLKKARIL